MPLGFPGCAPFVRGSRSAGRGGDRLGLAAGTRPSGPGGHQSRHPGRPRRRRDVAALATGRSRPQRLDPDQPGRWPRWPAAMA